MMFDRNSPARCFAAAATPPSSWKSRPSPLSEKKRSPASSASVNNNKNDLFHVIHKVPAGDSPYVKAKQVQLVDKDPSRAIAMFWAAINAGDRVESALKDMALVMKQLNRSDEAIEAIKSFRHLCHSESQDSLDNILVELYKRSGRIDEEIAMLHHKLKRIEAGETFVGPTKQARSQGRKILVTAEQEISRVLGNLAWAYLQKGDYKTAEEHYRKALSFEVDRNKQCNLAICLMQMNRITEAKFLLQAVSTATKNRKMDDSFVRSFERASEMLIEMDSSPLVNQVKSMPQCSPQSQPVDVEVSHARRRLYESPDPARRDQKAVPYTKPKRNLWGFNNGYQRETRGDVQSDPRPSFWSPHNVLPSPNNGRWRAGELDGAKEYSSAIDTDQNLHQGSQTSLSVSAVHSSSGNEKLPENLISLSGNSRLLEKKSWADLVEEEENDENTSSNIIFQHPWPHSQTECLTKNLGLKDRNTVRRYLSFYPELTPPSKEIDSLSSGDSGDNKLTRRNRLQVFQDITPETPRSHDLGP